MTLKRSFCLIVSATAVIVILLSTAAVRICSIKHDQITLSHAFVANGALIYPGNGRYVMETAADGTMDDMADGIMDGTADGTMDGIKDASVEYTHNELLLCRTLELLMVLLPVLFSLSGIGCAAACFYHSRLKEPLKALRRGIRHIADNDLDFTIEYGKQDELGQLCSAFEAMRKELAANNRHMWSLVEERRKINASIAHDLRTPITVIKGYSEYLDNNTGKGSLTQQGIREIAGYIHQAADRLEQYADSVHEIQALEDLRLEYQETGLKAFAEEMRSHLSILAAQSAKEIQVSARLPEQTASLSPAALFRITENLIANALRYCKEEIQVELSFSQPFLSLTVTDDGKGFSGKDLAEATDYFYKGKSAKTHFGIGLSICKTLAEKHGGSIRLENAPGKGAKVTVTIKTENPSRL